MTHTQNTTQERTAHYNKMWQMYQQGQIDEQAWVDFCKQALSEILDEPEIKDVMTRLKNRGD